MTDKNLYAVIGDVATFGQNLKRWREARGITQEELARRLRLKRPAQISIVENSPNTPRARTVLNYAAALRIEGAALLEDVETDYDRIRRGKPLETQHKPERRMAVGESPPAVGRRPVRGRSVHPNR